MTSKKDRILLLGCRELAEILAFEGYSTVPYEHPEEVLLHAADEGARACIVSPDAVSLGRIGAFIRQLREAVPFTDVVVWAPEGSPEVVRRSMAEGARDVIFKPRPHEVVRSLERILADQQYLPEMLRYQNEMRDTDDFEGMSSRNPAMRRLFEECVRTAPTGVNILILGETGTGKELLARAYHRRSGRKGEFVALNCSAVQESLLDAELFGHVRGAFTGAREEKPGLFRAADGGTLFLDEIGDIPLSAQYRLLRVLQEGTIRPLGSEKEVEVDVRVIAATSAPLDEALADGSFREDLLYRLDVIRLVIPPLRERPEDVLYLFGRFSAQLAQQYNVTRPEVTDEFIEALGKAPWPGNVRQLENFTERLLLTRLQGPLTASDFRFLSGPPGGPAVEQAGLPAVAPSGYGVDLAGPLEHAVREAEVAYLKGILGRFRGRIQESARHAGINRRTLLRKMRKYGLKKDDFR